MTTKTFTVVVDYATLAGVGATEKIGKVTFTPRFVGNSAWTTDGLRIVDAQPVTMDVTSAGGPQNFVLGHPEGWLLGFTWIVSAVIEGRSVLGPMPIRTPAPDTVNALPSLLDVAPNTLPDVTVQTLVVPSSVADGDVLAKEGAGVVGIDPADLGGSAVDSVNGKTGPVTLTAADVGALPSSYTPPAAPTWGTIAGKPAVVAAGGDAAAARTAIGAGTSNLALGTTAGTALAGNYTPPIPTAAQVGAPATTTVPSINAGPIANRPATPVAGSLYIEVILP